MTFITRSEADELRKRQVHQDMIKLNLVKSSQDQEMEEEKQAVEYEPTSAPRNELWIKNQQELERQVQAFKVSSSERDRIRWKLIKKILAKVKESLLAGKIHLLVIDLFKRSVPLARGVLR